jgi:hypothetical protein
MASRESGIFCAGEVPTHASSIKKQKIKRDDKTTLFVMPDSFRDD